MKLLDWLHPWDGMGQGVRAPARPSSRLGWFRDDQRKLYRAIARVIIETPEDPAEGMRWLLTDAEGRILLILPGSSVPAAAMLRQMRHVPGFSRHALRRAMLADRRGRYTIWRRDLPTCAA